MKLVHKFTLCLISLILFSSLTGYFAIIQSKKIIHDAFINNSEILALEMLNGLERELAIMIRAFNSYSYDELIQQDLITSNREFDKLGDAQAYINNQDEEWPSTTGEKITPFIHDILNSDLSKKLKQKLAFYEQSYGYKVIGEFFITNKYGANIAQTGITSDYRQDDEDWWQIAKRDDLYIGEIDLDKSADMQSVSIGIRIEDEDYNFLGVMKVILNIEYVTQFIKEMDPPGIHKQHNTMAYKIITKEGNLIYSSTGNHKLLEHIHDILPQEHLEPEDDHNAISSMILTREEKGRELFVVHAHSKGNSTISSLGWILLVEQDSEELFAPAIELRNQILAVTLSVSLISLIIGFIISGSLTKRIQKFKNIIVTLGRGELNVNIDTGSKDELGDNS
jgi:methyl-accepting chemotaxis protein